MMIPNGNSVLTPRAHPKRQRRGLIKARSKGCEATVGLGMIGLIYLSAESAASSALG